MTDDKTAPGSAPESSPSKPNFALQTALRVFLVLLIVGQVVFLAGRWRVRADLTADGLYTLTGTSQEILGALEDRLLIECYFSDESRLPAYYRPNRRTLTNFLEEYEKLGEGKVVVQYFDPHEDNLLREKADRLGIKPQTVSDAGQASYTIKEVWQGLRLMYGADKQQVIPYLFPQAATFAYEAILIPVIKDLTIAEKPKIAMIASQTEVEAVARQMGGQPGPRKGFTRIAEYVRSRYEIEPISLAEGELVPDQYDRLLLMRPKRLTDRQKYALDQFLMRGGSLIVFADTAEVQIGRYRSMVTAWVSPDSDDSSLKLLDQLAHYGAVVGEETVVDCFRDSSVPFRIPVQTQMGRMMQDFPYPYWLHARNIDYSAQAEQIATGLGATTKELVDQYRKTFKSGIEVEHDLFKGMKEGQAGPTLFWPCSADLAEKLPEGVTGEVVLRTSPLAYAERHVGTLHPVGRQADPRKWQEEYGKFTDALQRNLKSEPRQQFGLMVALEGTFQSFFADKEVPPRNENEAQSEPEPKDDDKDEAKDPLDAPLGEDAGKDEIVGPPAPTSAGQGKDGDPARIARAPASAKLIVVADSDFVRDDLITGEHQQLGGPVSPLGPAFFLNLLDWLAQDRDLLELRNKQIEISKISFGERGLGERADAEFARKVRTRERVFQWVNVAVPGLAMLVLWLVVSVNRRARKRAFLSSVGN